MKTFAVPGLHSNRLIWLLLIIVLGFSAKAQESNRPPDLNLNKKGIKPRHIRDMEAEAAHEKTKSPIAGGAHDVGTKFYLELESANSNESYDPNYMSTKAERRARWRKWFRPEDYVPNTQKAKKKREKEDSKDVINWKGDLSPNIKPNHEQYSSYSGFIRMKKSGDRTLLPGFQRRVKIRQHRDKGTEKGLWYD